MGCTRDAELTRRITNVQHDASQPFNWDVVKRIVRDYLEHPALRKSNAAKSFFNARRGADSISELERHLIELEAELDFHIQPEKARLWFYFSKLPPIIQQKMQEQDRLKKLDSPTFTVAQLFSEARGLEAVLPPTERKRSGPGTAPQSSRNETHTGAAQKAAKQEFGRSQPRASSRSRHNPATGVNARPPTRINRDRVPFRPGRPKANVECYHCYAKGHYASECPKQQSGNGNP
jgi:hypothetical protein